MHAGIALDAHPDRLARAQLGRGPFGHGQLKPQRIGADDGEDGRARRPVFTDRAPVSRTAPSIGERRIVSSSCWRARSSSERRCASTPCGFESPRSRPDAVPRRLRGGFGGVEIPARREAAIEECLHAIPAEPRLLQHGATLAQEAGALDVHFVFVSRGRQAEADPGLVERGLCLVQPELEIGGKETGEDLPLVDRTSQIDVDRIDAARNLEGEGHLLFSGQRPGNGHHPFEGLFAHEHAGHLPGCIGVSGRGRNRPGRARAPRRQQRQYESDGFYSQDWSPHSGAIVTQNRDFTQSAEGRAGPRGRRF